MLTKTRSVISEDIESILDELEEPLRALNGTTLIVTGASGFLCSYFVETIAALNERGLNKPCRVLTVDNFKTGTPERLAHLQNQAEIEFIQHDVTRPIAIEREVDWIVHGASIASPTFYRRYPLETIDVNVTGTRYMLDLARQKRARSMLYLSTSEVYGDPDPNFVPTSEEYRGNVSFTGPRACYDESKRLAETLCTTYHRLYELPVKIVRPFNVYGPGQRLDDKRIIPDLMRSVLAHEPIILYSNGQASRAFCYIADAIRAMWYVLLSDANGEAFNVGNDQEELAIEEVAICASQLEEPALKIERRVSKDAQYLTDNPQRRCPDLTKLRTRFPWQAKVSLSEGLNRTRRSYLENAE